MMLSLKNFILKFHNYNHFIVKDRKLFIFFTIIVLYTSVFSTLFKASFGRLAGGSIYIFFELTFILLFVIKSLSKNKLLFDKLDLPVLIYFLYGFFCVSWSAAHNYDTFDIFFKYRVVFLPSVLYFTVRFFLNIYPIKLNVLYKIIFVLIAFVSIATIIEFVYSNILSLNKLDLFWVNFGICYGPKPKINYKIGPWFVTKRK